MSVFDKSYSPLILIFFYHLSLDRSISDTEAKLYFGFCLKGFQENLELKASWLIFTIYTLSNLGSIRVQG